MAAAYPEVRHAPADVVTQILTLDGVAQAPGGPDEDTSGGFPYGGWVVPHFDDAMGRQIDEWFAGAQDFLLAGRSTYEIFAAWWPKAPTEDDPIARALNTLPKHVTSRTLRSVDSAAPAGRGRRRGRRPGAEGAPTAASCRCTGALG